MVQFTKCWAVPWVSFIFLRIEMCFWEYGLLQYAWTMKIRSGRNRTRLHTQWKYISCYSSRHQISIAVAELSKKYVKKEVHKGRQGRSLMGIQKMLRRHLLQFWFNLSEPVTEDLLAPNNGVCHQWQRSETRPNGRAWKIRSRDTLSSCPAF